MIYDCMAPMAICAPGTGEPALRATTFEAFGEYLEIQEALKAAESNAAWAEFELENKK